MLFQNLDGKGIIGRYGGDEFLILCEEVDVKKTHELIEHLLCQIPKIGFEEGIPFSASGGMVFFDGNTNINEVLADADKPLFRVKLNGKNDILLDDHSHILEQKS